MKRRMLLSCVTVLIATLLAAEDALFLPAPGAATAPVTANPTAADAITIPRILSYQGRLTDSLGNPVPDSSYQLTFRLYTQETGGTAFWNETQTVQLKSGLFSVLLGSVNPIPYVPDPGGLYLSLQIGAGTELTPRLRIVSTAYAFKADSANYAAPTGNAGGDLTGTYPNPVIAASAVTSAKIQDGAITAADLNQMGANTGQVLKWNGTQWMPANDEVGTGDNAWVRGTPDSVLFTIRSLGIARGGANSMLYGSARHTHINLGSACTTGTAAQNYTYCTVAGGSGNSAGGGAATVGGGVNNRATGSYATVAGGFQNSAAGTDATVAGGVGNSASGYIATVGGGYADTALAVYSGVFTGYRNKAGDDANDTAATVAGGVNNSVRGKYGVIGGGFGNVVSGIYGTNGGGINNIVDGGYGTIAGGVRNYLTGAYAAVGGGYSDTVTGNFAVIAGGSRNKAEGMLSTIGGGEFNRSSGYGASISGGSANTTGANCATISGGQYNSVTGGYGTIGGGNQNLVNAHYGSVFSGDTNNAGFRASDTGAVVVGGRMNLASAKFSFIGGGRYNNASGAYASISGGYNNYADTNYATVGGGRENQASGYGATVTGGAYNQALRDYAVVSGQGNSVTADNGVISGGYLNSVSGSCGTVPGGYADSARAFYSFATNRFSLALHENSAAFNGQATTAINQTRVGILSKASGSFTIDHPLDPYGKILNHYFIEGPEMRNIYEGSVVLDEQGRAEVRLPDYFSALNRNPHIQLTGVGTSDVYVAEKISGNRFVIGGRPGTEVYWLVTGERQDVSAEATRRLMPVEQKKTGDLAGRMLDDDFLAGCMEQLEREGRAAGIDFRTPEGRRRYQQRKNPPVPER